MDWVLVTNDDGVDSPALVPFAKAIAAHGTVRVVVPDVERSWSGKAITRFSPVTTGIVERDGLVLHTHSGTPADGVQLGVHALFPTPPKLVVSGINLGYNHGAGYLWSSGTVGAAVEGWVSGIPSIAVSTGVMTGWETWRAEASSPGAASRWVALAELGSAIIGDVVMAGVFGHADVVSVNIPWTATATTERRLTGVARTGYDRLFEAIGPDTYTHRYGGGITMNGDVADNDVDAAHDGVVSITPLRMPEAARLPGGPASHVVRPHPS